MSRKAKCDCCNCRCQDVKHKPEPFYQPFYQTCASPYRVGWQSATEIGSDFSRSLMKDDPGRWPLLLRASANVRPAHNPRVEWIIDANAKCDMGHTHPVRKAEFNYTQIFRVEVPTAEASKRYGANPKLGLDVLFDNIESALRHGVRSSGTGYSYHGPIRTMGGVQELLGRWPRVSDNLGLVVLRDLGYCVMPFTDAREWLVELTLQATKAKGR